jgi:hypothetical protein
MKKFAVTVAGMLLASAAIASTLSDADKLICSTGNALLCYEEGSCTYVVAFDVGIPDFILVDMDKHSLTAVGTSDAERSTSIDHLARENGVIYLQGNELGRSFSIVIDELTGRMTAAIASDGLTITTFGACTDADAL